MDLLLKIIFAISTTIALGLGLFILGDELEKDNSFTEPVVIEVDEKILEEISLNKEAIPETIIEEVLVSSYGAYIVSNGEVLNSFRKDKRWPIASITKLMTAVVARKLMSGEEEVVITEDILAIEGSSGGFVLNDIYTIDDLISAMMIVSSNDAAYAIASHFGEEDFILEMNLFAKNIGMDNTTFKDSSGLSPQNLSTADDLYKLGNYVWENEKDILSISRVKSATIYSVNIGNPIILININEFSGRIDFLGGKTGQIPEAGGNLLSIFMHEDYDEPILIIVLGASERFMETEKILMEL